MGQAILRLLGFDVGAGSSSGIRVSSIDDAAGWRPDRRHGRHQGLTTLTHVACCTLLLILWLER